MFQRGLCFHVEETIHRDDKMHELVPLPEAGLWVFFILLFFRRLETLLRRLVLLRRYVCIRDTHVMNIICHSLSYVADHYISLLFSCVLNVS